MEIKVSFCQYNVNVFDLKKSVKLHEEAFQAGYWIEILPMNK